MKLIIASKTHGNFDILYDEEDDHIVQAHTWHITKMGNGRFYASTNITLADGKQRIKALHQLIMKTPKGMCTDHISGDTLDNRRKNLRVCTYAENTRNRGKNKSNTSGFIGVYENKNGWQATVCHEGKNKYLGTFDTRPEAARVRDRATVRLRNVVTPQMLNFPEEHGF